MSIELKEAAQQAIEAIQDLRGYRPDIDKAIEALRTAIQQAEAQQPAVGERLMGQVSLPDGSAFAIASFPLPKDHWLYAPREYATGAEEPLELPTPILTHDQREAVVTAIRYAVRGATMCGREQDFDPDAMVQNAVYALCGPYARVSAENTQASVNLALAQQPATTEPVQTTPNFTQLMQILDGLNRCHSRDSKVEFLRSWIRDWTQHKVDKLTHPAPSVLDDVVRDAERYRWLRDRDHWPAPFASSQDPEPVRGIDLDAAIDAAMLAAKKASA